MPRYMRFSDHTPLADCLRGPTSLWCAVRAAAPWHGKSLPVLTCFVFVKFVALFHIRES